MKANDFSYRALMLEILACLVMAGCTVGPDFQRPATSTPAQVFDRTQSEQAPSKAVESGFNSDWWTLFNDPTLNALEQQLADANLDVAAASARLRQSRAEQRVAGAAEYPTLDGAASYDRERGSPNGILGLLGVSPTDTPSQSASGDTPLGVAPLPGSKGSPAYNLYQAGFDTSWELDIWGRNRRGVEAASALADASYEDRNAVLLAARAELARDYIELRDTQSLLRIAKQNLEIARDTTKLTQVRAHEGVTTDLDVANASAQAASIESLIPTLESRCTTTINAIGVLLAEEPGALAQTLGEPHDVPALPAQAPKGGSAVACGHGVDRNGKGRLLSAHIAERQCRFPEPSALEPRQLGVGTVCCRPLHHDADLRRRTPQGDAALTRGATTGSCDRLQTHRTRGLARSGRCPCRL
jgi:outer membrane protein TolC